MIYILIAFGGGLAVGGVFALIGATAPAPPNAAGLMGVVGITAGYALARALLGR